MAPARKMARYRVVFANMNRIAGNVGLNVGTTPDVPGIGPLGMGMTGGTDWGPCGEGSNASNEVESSIVYDTDEFSQFESSTR